MLSITHIVGIVLTICILIGIGVLSGRKVNDAKSFAAGKGSRSSMVFGIIMGSLAGGQSTIGTAQLAYCYGLSAWWFTIGAAAGCVVLALFFLKPLRKSQCLTLSEIIAKKFGHKAETIGSILCIVGIFLSIVSQVIASSAMMTSLFKIALPFAAAISTALIICLIFFGGLHSAGVSGILKSLLLVIASAVSLIVVLQHCGTIKNFSADLHSFLSSTGITQAIGIDNSPEAIHQRYGNLIGRGLLKDCGGALSLLLGVLATQTYAQAIFSARGERQARRGTLLSAFLLPVIGAACTMVGIFMRSHSITADELEYLQTAGVTMPYNTIVLSNTAQAFPSFIINYCPDWIGGVILGTLFVTVISGGSGLALGVATILVRDVYSNIPRLKQFAQGKTSYRATIVALMCIAMITSITNHKTLINELGFLALGLRATALLLPLFCALFVKKELSQKTIIASMIIGTLSMLAAALMHLPGDAIFYGINCGLLPIAISIVGKK